MYLLALLGRFIDQNDRFPYPFIYWGLKKVPIPGGASGGSDEADYGEFENSELEGSKKTFHFNIDRFCFCSVPLVCLIQSVLLVLTPMMIPWVSVVFV